MDLPSLEILSKGIFRARPKKYLLVSNSSTNRPKNLKTNK